MSNAPAVPTVDAPTRAQAAAEPVRSLDPESFGDRFHALPHIVCARRGDAVALMDQRSGKYVTLDAVSGRIWDLVAAGATTGEIIGRLEHEYDVAREQLEADVGRTLQQFLAGGLVARGPSPEPIHIPSMLRCGLVIFAVKTSLRIRGFARTLAWIRRRVEPIAPTAAADVDAVRRAERAVAMAGAFYPGRARCLEQSLALYYLLRRQGVGATYCQGVQFYPFLAHAWVEYRGEVINDVGPHVKHFARFPDQLP